MRGQKPERRYTRAELAELQRAAESGYSFQGERIIELLRYTRRLDMAVKTAKVYHDGMCAKCKAKQPCDVGVVLRGVVIESPRDPA